MPVRSPRYVYQVNISVNQDDDPDAIDSPDDAGDGDNVSSRNIFVKMKKSIGDWLGLTPLAYDDPIWTGIFNENQTGATNKGYSYRRRLGGFRVGSYTLIAETKFEIPELVRQDDGSYETVTTDFKSISIGFPVGHTVHEFITWLGTTERISEVAIIRTPAGNGIAIYAGSDDSGGETP